MELTGYSTTTSCTAVCKQVIACSPFLVSCALALSQATVLRICAIGSNPLSILYYNARSLLPKFDELAATVEDL